MANDWQAQTQARYMSYVGTGQRPTIDATARDVQALPFVLAQPQEKPFNPGALWAGLVGAKKNGRTYENAAPAVVSAVVSDPKPKAEGESFTEAPKS
jgi:hypothetical protein